MKVDQSGELKYHEWFTTAEDLILRHDPDREANRKEIGQATREMLDRDGQGA